MSLLCYVWAGVFVTVFYIFNILAERYDRWYNRNWITALNELRLVEAMMSSERRTCIEVGGGTGFFASRLGCINIDPAEKVLAISKRKGVDSVQGVGELLPIRHDSADIVLVIVTLCFVDKPTMLLAESRRVLRDNGVLIVCIVPRDSPWGIYYIARKDKSPFYRYAHFYTLLEVEKMLSDVGFVVIDEKAVLSYRPWEKPRHEFPTKPTRRHGFVCIKAAKR